MLSLFKRKQNNEVIVAPPFEKAVLKGKTTNEIIEEIHEAFYTEVDRLLADAKIMKSTETTKQDLIDKCERLKKLGFTETKEVKEAEAEIARIFALEFENRNKGTLTEAINYFSVKYPQYKFITEDSVNRICEKYSLVYATISRYIGTVPDKNLKQMEDFKIKDEDACYEKTDIMFLHYGRQRKPNYCNYNEYKRYMGIEDEDKYEGMPYEERLIAEQRKVMIRSMIDERVDKCSLEIAAPLKDFDTKNSQLEGFKLSTKIEIPDPVVLQPVYYGGQKHYLIVTCWGLEASDELVVNQKMN